MSENILIALIAGGSALFGGVIGGLISMMTAKYSADREDKRRKEEAERQKANERLEKLYDPLLQLINPRPPFDEYHLDKEDKKEILFIVGNNEIYASKDLMNIVWSLRYEIYGTANEEYGLDWNLLRLVQKEHTELKEMLGYGNIIKKDLKVKNLARMMFFMLKKPYIIINDKIQNYKMKRRRRKIHRK